MITFKRIRGKHIVTVDGVETECVTMWEALEKIYKAYIRRILA